ncbi:MULTISPECIES: class I SAM-dependent methyltransferase [unclassified Streptomyces]|uniref:class I SAM-dependent methyltransferase n=1 Tax=unclassified Streptomyces TaxID=2593676 RepID=UPI002E291226|nr:class I SAM-dependent methyltransferase [Streptomyces sp. NBC_00223]
MAGFDEFERRAWGGRAEAYGRSFGLLCAHTVPRLLDVAGVGVGVRVLDVGTGTGTVAAAAGARGAKVTAVDAEPSMVVAAGRAAPSAEVRLAVLPELPFADDEFDAVVGNFVLNHVGRPAAALAELRRVTRPGGRIALTVWASPPASGQALLGRAVQAAGVTRPADAPRLAAQDDFPRTETGFAALLVDAGLAAPACETLAWTHHVDAEAWWSGPAAGIATIGQIVTAQPPAVIASIRAHYDALCAPFRTPAGPLALPHTALLAHATA